MILILSSRSRPGIAPGAAFSPLFLVDFDGLSNGQSVTLDTAGSTSGKRFSYWGTYSNSFGSRAVTGFAYSGNTSSAELSVQSGNDGGTGGGTGPNGGFGGGFSSSANFPHVGEGEEIWLGMLMYVPSGYNWTTNTSIGLKGFRFLQPGTGAKIEHHFGYGAGGVNNGINILTELQNVTDTYQVHALDRVVTPGAWNWVEVYIKASATAANCARRVWINDQMVIERVAGVNTKYHASGAWQTQTHAVNEYILTNSSNYLDGLMLFTYWNGGAPATQTLNVQKLVGHKTAADLTATDEFGNKMIGSAFGIAA